MNAVPFPWRTGACLLLFMYLLNAVEYGFSLWLWPASALAWFLGAWGFWLIGAMVIRSRLQFHRRQRAELMAAMEEIKTLLADIEDPRAIIDRCPDHDQKNALDRSPLL